MLHTQLALGLLTLGLSAPFALAQSTAPEPAKSVVNAVDPASIQTLKGMGVLLLTLKRFSMATELTCERVLADGQTNAGGLASALQHVVRPVTIGGIAMHAKNQKFMGRSLD